MNTILTLVIVNYNQGNYFEDCISSVSEQHLNNFQLIVIDDCSTDGSAETIERLLQAYNISADFIKNKKNQGICSNLNMALNVARGKYFSFIASDDWVERDCYINMIRAFETAADQVAVVYGDCKIVDQNKRLLHNSYLKYFRKDLEAAPEGLIFKDLLKGNFIPAMVTMTKTEILQKLGGFDENLKVEDYDMWLRISRNYHFLYEKNAFAYYRILPNSLIRRIGARKYEDWIDMYLKHKDAEPAAFSIVKEQLLTCCEFLFYTDSNKFIYYYNAIRKFGINNKLKIIRFFEWAGIKGSAFKRWSNKLKGRKVEPI
jgi:glycosyltransferase involved in cell wall biosynthesis